MKFEYNLIRSRRKTLALMITKDGELEARAPMKMPLDVIEAFIIKKQDWIEKKITLVKNRIEIKPKSYTAGEMFLYQGQSYELSFTEEQRLPVELRDKLYLAARHQHRAKKVLSDWYKQEAYKIFRTKIDYYSSVTGIQPQAVKLSNANQRWGSCTAKGIVNLSWRLIMAQPDIIDYVIIHELVHIRQHNHSHKFWGLVEQIMPDYQERRKWLKMNGIYLHI